MRVVFLGTPKFAATVLEALTKKYEVAAAVCQPDREKDRKGRLIPCAVKELAESLGIPVFQFEKIRRDGVGTLREIAPDLMITAAYGQILSQEILDIPRFGTLNVHGSLLPKYRGSAPIQRAIADGLTETGVTIMRTDAGMDTGDILSETKVNIDDNDYVDAVYEKLAAAGSELLLNTIESYVGGRIKPVPQNGELATNAPPIKKEEYFIDFSRPACEVRNRIRGFGYGVCTLGENPLKVYRLDLADGKGGLGEVIKADKNGITVACGEGAVSFTEVQASGKKRMKTADFLNGVKVPVGTVLR